MLDQPDHSALGIFLGDGDLVLGDHPLQSALPTAGGGWIPHPKSAFVQAIARAFWWRQLLESGVYSSVADLAIAEGVNDSYVSRTIRLTLLAPKIVEASLARQGEAPLMLKIVLRPFPVDWSHQLQFLFGR